MTMFIQGSAMQQANMRFKMQQNKTNMTANFADKMLGKSQAKNTQGPSSTASLIAEKVSEDLKTNNVLRKIARGEHLTPREREHLEKVSPDQKQKAEAANEERKQLKVRVAQAKTEKQAREAIAQAKMGAQVVFDKGDEEMGTLLFEAALKVEEEYSGQKSNDAENDLDANATGWHDLRKKSKEDIARFVDIKK